MSSFPVTNTDAVEMLRVVFGTLCCADHSTRVVQSMLHSVDISLEWCWDCIKLCEDISFGVDVVSVLVSILKETQKLKTIPQQSYNVLVTIY